MPGKPIQKVLDTIKGIAKKLPIEIVTAKASEPKPTGQTITLDSIGSLYQDHLLIVHKKAETGAMTITVAKHRNASQPKPMPGMPEKKKK